MNNIYLGIYNNLIKLTRNKNLYNTSKEDTFYDRLIIFFFHLSIILKVYKDIETKENLQKFFDFCIKQIELSIREIGYGDATINKKMKDYVNILFSIIDKIDNWDILKNQQKAKIINNFKEDTSKCDFYIKYFDNFNNFVSNNTFNSLSKDIISFK